MAAIPYNKNAIQSIKPKSIRLNGIDIEVEWKTIKAMHLSVYPPNGRVHISAPKEYSIPQVENYVLEKWVWLAEKRKLASAHSIQSPRQFVSGEEHFWRGKSYRLKVDVTKNAPFKVKVDGDYIHLFVHEGTSVQRKSELLDEWYRSDLRLVAEPLIAKWEDILNVKVAEWSIVKMPMRWGSCTQATKRIVLNLELAKKPLNCVEYVVAHELVHLLERLHNEHFRQLLFMHLPNWREIRQQLNDFPLTDMEKR